MTSHIILDPSKEYVVREGFTLIDSEVDFLRADGVAKQLWVRGARVCGWINDVYSARGFPLAVTFEELPPPRERLRALIGDKADDVSSGTIRRMLGELARGDQLTSAVLLSALSGGNDFWVSHPSVEHAARWLLTAVDPDLLPLVEAQQLKWVASCDVGELKTVYATPIGSRVKVLIRWLLADQSPHGLGVFPLPVHGWAEELMRDEWEKRLRATKGAALETLSLDGPNSSHLGDVAYEYFIHNPDQLTETAVARLAPILDDYSRRRLERVWVRGR